MNKEELVNAVAEKTEGITKKDIAEVVTATISAITGAVKKGQKVTLVGFGTFEAKRRAARTCRNPKTGESVAVAERVLPIFKAGKVFKDEVNS